MQELVKTDAGGVSVTVGPIGALWAVNIEHQEEPFAIGRTPRIARVRAMVILRRKLRDIEHAVRAGRARALYRRWRLLLEALERLEAES